MEQSNQNTHGVTLEPETKFRIPDKELEQFYLQLGMLAHQEHLHPDSSRSEILKRLVGTLRSFKVELEHLHRRSSSDTLAAMLQLLDLHLTDLSRLRKVSGNY